MPDYGSVHTTLMQVFLARRSMTSKEAAQQLKLIVETSEDETSPDSIEDSLDDYIDGLNKVLDSLEMRIVKKRDQSVAGVFHYTIVNRQTEAIAALATSLQLAELDFFKAMLEEIWTSTHRPESFSLPMSGLADCRRHLSPSTKMKPISGREAAELVDKLVQQSWFDRTDDNVLSPTPRLLVELASYLAANYGPDGSDTLRTCIACNDIFTKGKQCLTVNCPVRLHLSCQEAFFQQNAGPNCPKCRRDLSEENLTVV